MCAQGNHEVELPDIFLFSHPLGTILGRARYANYFLVYQHCTIGSNLDGIYPTFGEGVAMFGGKNVEFPEEIYQLKEPYDSKAVHMLLRLDTDKTDMKVGGLKRTDNDYGIAWARPWEKGRVFYCSLGHNHEMYWNPKVIRHYLAGIQWALGDFKVVVNSAR